MNTDLQPLYKKIKPLIGQRPWEVWLGWGSFITLEFGKKIELEGSHRPHGEWCLWVYMSAWRLETRAEVITASEDSREGMSTGIKLLEGLALRSIKLQPPSLETTLIFDNNLILRLFPIYSEDTELDDWILFCPDGHTVSVGGGQWTIGQKDEA